MHFKVDVTVSQRCKCKFKMKARIFILAIQLIDDEQHKVRNSKKVPNFDVGFRDRKQFRLQTES